MEFLFRSIEILSACLTQKSSYNFTKENLAGKNWREYHFEKKWWEKLAGNFGGNKILRKNGGKIWRENLAGIKFREKMAGKFGGKIWRQNLAAKFGGKIWRQKLTRRN
jgi:hypothetical protein